MKNTNTKSKKTFLMVIALLALLIAPLAALSQDTGLQQAMDRAAAAGVDQERLNQIQERASARGVDDALLARLLEPAADLAENNMPSDFVLQKILEGFSKGVPGGRMMPVIESIHSQTPQAVAMADRWIAGAEVAPFMQAMGGQQPRFRQDLVNAGLKSLTQNVAAETIESVLNELGRAPVLERTSPQAIAAAVGILPDLPASVLNEKGVHELIAKAVEGGFSAADIQRLPGAMNAAERRSELPAAAILNGMSDQIGSGIPANQILQNLFNGNINAGPPHGIPGRPGNRPGGRPDGRGNSGGF